MVLLPQQMSLEDFLAWENQQVEKHEFHRGEVFAAVGEGRRHGRVVLNLASRLAMQLDHSPCQVFIGTMKLQIAEDTLLYPDLFVTCDKADLATEMIFRSPTLVIEVLSPSTQAYDRSQKFALYRRIPTLQEYILVDPDTRRVEAFRRGADGLWDLHDMSEAQTMEAAGIGCQVAMADVFAGIEPSPAP
jgi:Uma2 family endonuclease